MKRERNSSLQSAVMVIDLTVEDSEEESPTHRTKVRSLSLNSDIPAFKRAFHIFCSCVSFFFTYIKQRHVVYEAIFCPLMCALNFAVHMSCSGIKTT